MSLEKSEFEAIAQATEKYISELRESKTPDEIKAMLLRGYMSSASGAEELIHGTEETNA